MKESDAVIHSVGALLEGDTYQQAIKSRDPLILARELFEEL